MIDLMNFQVNTWIPDLLDTDTKSCCIKEAQQADALEFLSIFQIEPYIDTLYIRLNATTRECEVEKRFIFHKGYAWDYEDEYFFIDHCLKNPGLKYTYSAMDKIFGYYSEEYPDWKLQRYYTKSMRLLDHIYHCLKQGTGKEILYKAALDELAENIDVMDEINLLSSKPSDIYEGVPVRVLRALNCHDGALLLSKDIYRQFLIELNMKFPIVFKDRLNDAQCRYLMHLIDGDLTVGEAGRLFKARKMDLMMIWAPSQYEMFLWKEKLNQQTVDEANKVAKIDPIYATHVKNYDFENTYDNHSEIKSLSYYLLYHREEFDRLIRRANRKRDYDWQERDHGYVVRYPQTTNDFCREAIYMSNCLLTYMDAFVNNDTTILFMRKCLDVNAPFITMEIYEGELMQAYHRFNDDCTSEEAAWICDYCERHSIGHDKFKFNKDVDQLF